MTRPTVTAEAANELAKLKAELAFAYARFETACADNVRLIAAMDAAAADLRNLPGPRTHEIAGRLEEQITGFVSKCDLHEG